MIAALVALLLAAPLSQAPGDARPQVLARTPSSLPRAAAGAWDAFVTAEESAALAGLPAEVLAGLQAAEASYRAERYPTALEELYALLESHPDLPPALLLLGTTYFRLRRYDDCRIAMERFLEVAPKSLWRTQALGHSYYSLGDYERAKLHYEAVLAATPAPPDGAPPGFGESVEALRGLALCHARLGDRARALELLDRVLDLRPDHAEALTLRARLLHEEGRLEQALAAAERARELSPYEPQPWFQAMRILYDLDRIEEAEAAEARWKELDRVAQQVRNLEMRLRFEPGQYEVVLGLCRLFASIGDRERLRGALAELVRARPDAIPEVEVRIFVLDELERQGDAEAAHLAALALEQACASEAAAWRRLERHYALFRDRANQVRCGAEAARLEAAGR